MNTKKNRTIGIRTDDHYCSYFFVMKKLFLISPLLLSTMMFSSPPYAEWTKVVTDQNGDVLFLLF